MKIESKYKIGAEVYVVFKENDGIVRVFKDKIEELAISEKYGLKYYVSKIGEEFNEEELLLVSEQKLLISKIDKLLEIQ